MPREGKRPKQYLEWKSGMEAAAPTTNLMRETSAVEAAAVWSTISSVKMLRDVRTRSRGRSGNAGYR